MHPKVLREGKKRRRKAKAAPGDAPLSDARGEKLFSLTVESLLHGERGLARLAGRAVFVPFVVPGDRISLRIAKRHRRYLEGDLVEVLEASPHRRAVDCPVYGVCGGCHWLHIAYPFQLEAKEKNLRDCLQRLGRLEPGEVLPSVASVNEFGYRKRVRLRGRIRKGALEVGFLAPASHRVVPHERCWLYDPELLRFYERLSEAIPERCDGTVQIVSAIGEGRQDHQVVVPRPDLAEGLAEAFEAVCCGDVSWEVHCEQTGTALCGDAPRHVTYAVDGVRGEIRLRGAARAFMQANVETNRLLVSEVLAWADVGPGAEVVDLYGGNGNFAIPLASTGAKVRSVETDPEAVALARMNASSNAGETSIVEGHAERVARDWATAGRSLDLALIDPPRRGARDLVDPLVRLAPKKILYVSCEPSTLARDLAVLVAGGYELRRVRLFDMFPQTHHLETLAELVRRS